MVKYVLNFLFIFLILTSLSFAKNDDARLQNEYGRDLTHAPFFLRFSFQKEFNIDWKKSDYLQRKAFLADYEADLAKEQALEKAEARDEAAREKAYLTEKKEAARREKERFKVRLAKEKAEKLEEQARRKAAAAVMREQEDELREMTRRHGQGLGAAPSQQPDSGSAQGSY